MWHKRFDFFRCCYVNGGCRWQRYVFPCNIFNFKTKQSQRDWKNTHKAQNKSQIVIFWHDCITSVHSFRFWGLFMFYFVQWLHFARHCYWNREIRHFSPAQNANDIICNIRCCPLSGNNMCVRCMRIKIKICSYWNRTTCVLNGINFIRSCVREIVSNTKILEKIKVENSDIGHSKWLRPKLIQN